MFDNRGHHNSKFLHIMYVSLILLVIYFFITSLINGGITFDEPGIKAMINNHLRIGLSGAKLGSYLDYDIPYYGMVHLLPGYLLYRIVILFHDFGGSNQAVFYMVMHISFFIMGVATSWVIYNLLKLFNVNSAIALTSSALLLVYPTWIGSSFFNFKDIPASFFFTLYTYFICEYSIRKNNNISYKIAITGALLCSVKFAFVPIIVVNHLYLLCRVVFMGQNFMEQDHCLKKINNIMMIGLITIIFIYIMTPAAWRSPIFYLTNEIRLMSHHTWGGCTAILGNCINVQSANWQAWKYLLTWYIAQIPTFFILIFVPGLVVMFNNLVRNFKSHIIYIPILLQMLLLPILASIHNSVFYDGTRHTLFCVPMIVFISCIGLNWLLTNTINSVVLRRVFLTIASIVLFGSFTVLLCDLLTLNPYQYSYFNEWYRIFYADKKIDNDYWAFSYKEAYDTIADGVVASKVIKIYPDFIDISDYSNPKSQPADDKEWYLIGSLRTQNDVRRYIKDKSLNCDMIHEVQRNLLFLKDPMVMSVIFRCKS